MIKRSNYSIFQNPHVLRAFSSVVKHHAQSKILKLSNEQNARELLKLVQRLISQKSIYPRSQSGLIK